jgi:hypothetical protein
VELVTGRGVVVAVGLEGVDEAEVVDVPGDVGVQLADPRARLPVLGERVGAGEQCVVAAVEDVGELRRLDRLTD